MERPWLAPLAFLYGIGISIRNKLFDWRILRSVEYDIPVVCVGNITVGGTGKTPVTELLVDTLHGTWNIAVLSRGYKRRTKGYLEVQPGMSFLKTGDEPKQIKKKFPGVIVCVCEDRREGIAKIRERHPQVDLILLDDGFQHRRIEPWINIVLMDYTRPVYRDRLLPQGKLRDNLSQMHRANYVIVTKCPADINPLEKRIVKKSLGLYPYQQLYFTSMVSGQPLPLFEEGKGKILKEGQEVIAMSGIGNPESFRLGLEQKYEVTGVLEYPDHHPYRRRDIGDMENAFANSSPETVIIMTEKDAVKISGSKKIPEEMRGRLFYIPISVHFHDNTLNDFFNKLTNDLRANPKHSLLHP